MFRRNYEILEQFFTGQIVQGNNASLRGLLSRGLVHKGYAEVETKDGRIEVVEPVITTPKGRTYLRLVS
jgi:hypothetical protein